MTLDQAFASLSRAVGFQRHRRGQRRVMNGAAVFCGRRIVAERDTPGRAGAVCAQKTFFKYPGERRDYDDDSDLAVALTSASGAEVKLLEKASRWLRLMFFKLGMAGGPPTGMKIVAGEPWLYGRRSDGMRRQAPGAGDNKVQLAPGDQAFSSVFQV